jgi:hypothetical protein
MALEIVCLIMLFTLIATCGLFNFAKSLRLGGGCPLPSLLVAGEIHDEGTMLEISVTN